MSSKIAPDAEQINRPVVRTLKPPPENWELVHPVEFNSHQTFLRRLRSGAMNLILMAIVAGLIVGVGIAVFRFRSAQKSTPMKTIQPVQVGSTSTGSDTTNPKDSSAPPTDMSVTQPANVSVGNSRRAPSTSSKRKVSTDVEAGQPDIGSETATDVAPRAVRSQPTTADQRSTGAADSDLKSSSDSASGKPKPNPSLSPQVIAPLKSDSVRKAKVIQWP